MPNRRQFIGQLASAGVVFAGGGLSALQPAARRRQVTIGGRRVRTVDAHAHTFVPAVADVVKGTALEKSVAGSLSGSLVMSDERCG